MAKPSTPRGLPDVHAELRIMTEDLFNELSKTWSGMYEMKDTFMKCRYQRFIEHVKVFYKDILECEEQKRIDLEDEIEKKRQEINELKTVLGISFPITEVGDNDPLSVICKKLQNDLRQYDKLKEKRLQILKKHRAQEAELCNELGEEVLELKREIPTQEDLDLLDQHIYDLHEEKIRRRDHMDRCKEKLESIMKLLEVVPSSSFEINLFEDDPLNVHIDYFNQVKALLNTFEEKLNDEKLKCLALKSRLEKLWDRILEDRDYRENFNKNCISYGPTGVKMLEDEIARCELLKEERMGPFIQNLRLAIAGMWDKLAMSEEQRESFDLINNQSFSEDVLDAHEAELERLQQIYENHSGIYDLAHKRQKLWERMLQLDEASNDKNRYKNRGGTLLREEKERKSLEVQLPKADSELRDRLLAYQFETGSEFLWYGEPLLAKMTSEWEARTAEKELKKICRKEEQKRTVETEALFGAQVPQKRKAADGGSAIKNKMFKSDSIYKLNSETFLSAQSGGSKMTTPSSYKPSTRSRTNKADNESLVSYSFFQEEIDGKSRSPRSAKQVKPLRMLNHSSPTDEKEKKNGGSKKVSKEQFATPLSTPRALRSTPRRLAATPGNTPNRFTPKSTLKFTPAKNLRPINI